MRQVGANRIGLDQGSQMLFSDFEHDGRMWAGQGPREIRVSERFSEPFATPPLVHLSVSMWDMDQNTNQRGDIAAEAITKEGFDIVFRTWADTRIARIRCDWLAVGEAQDEDLWEV